MPSLLAALKKKYPKKKIAKKNIVKDKGKYKSAGVADGTAYYADGEEMFLIPSGDQMPKDTIELLIDAMHETDEHA